MDVLTHVANISAPLVVGGLVSFGLCVLVAITTRWHGAHTLDSANGIQKFHIHPTPRVGGLPMVLGLLAAVIMCPPDLRNKLWPWLIAGCPAFAFGLAEDFTKRVGVSARLFATMASGALACFLTGYALTRVDVWGLDWLLQYTAIAILFTSFAVGGVANAINIIDGLNGLASSMVIWALLAIAVLATRLGDTVLTAACLLIVVSVLGFILVNWPFGKLFLGDGGSYFLGFSLAWACVLLVERHSEVSPFAPLLLCVHPVTEVLFSVFRRRMRRQHPGQPDRLHLHSLVNRRMMQRWLPHGSKTVHNSVGGLLIGSMSLPPAVLVQWIYGSTPACLTAVIALGAGYIWLYQRMLARFGA